MIYSVIIIIANPIAMLLFMFTKDWQKEVYTQYCSGHIDQLRCGEVKLTPPLQYTVRYNAGDLFLIQYVC